MRTGTDDFENPVVQKCISRILKKDKISLGTEPACKLSAKYKTKFCEQLVKVGYEKSVSVCFQSVENLPNVVINGGG